MQGTTTLSKINTFMFEVLTQELERMERQPSHKALYFAVKINPKETTPNVTRMLNYTHKTFTKLL